jgi:alkylation response protein AidB-like acyl-CoA dehydrogenase
MAKVGFSFETISEIRMHIDFTPEQKQLRKQIRNYFNELFTPELRKAFDAEMHEVGGPVYRQIVEKMGADGWLGIGWPKEFGGQGRTALEQFIFWDEVYRARAPRHVIATNTVGPTIMQFGTEQQKKDLLPGILNGTLHFGIGYTEGEAGTDLATLQTTAVRDGDEWVINGQKLFTTHAHDAQYIWMACRTNPEEKRHKGISIILVPTDAEGYSCTPIYTLGYERTNVTYYENVRVPVTNLIGEENKGWSLLTSQLNHERIVLAAPGIADKMLDDVWRYATETKDVSGKRMIDHQWVQLNLARVKAKLEALTTLNWRMAWSISQGHPDMAEASAVKVFGTELFIECDKLMLEIVGAAGVVKEGEPGAIFGGHLEHTYRAATTLTFGGGVNEVQRDIIAMAGLLLPRPARR